MCKVFDEGSIREHGISSSSLFEFIEMLCSFECQRRKGRFGRTKCKNFHNLYLLNTMRRRRINL
ncbi:hypothetical protein IC582_022793 [Cucumis melo]